MHNYVYLFTEDDGSMKNLLAGQGPNLAEMTNLGMPVPMGFTISTEACTQYYEDAQVIVPELEQATYANIATLEEITGKNVGDL